MNPGSIVRCRNRDWVLLPSDSPDVFLLRPLTGATDEVVAVHKQLTDLIGYTLPEERVRPATFPLPTPDDVADAASAELLWQAARLTLREGATPFRSLGRISIRPRIYQFVPLLMALRLDPIRLLIADDVGVGKTIEALLIAREMFDRGEIKRLCVLCPPYLCDQWQKELTEKFNLEAVVIRSGTVRQLDRQKTNHQQSIYEYYPVQVASIDFVKSDRNRHLFLLNPPEFIIVDEAHGSATANPTNRNQHERHELVREIAKDCNRHLVLLTATPHSGIETAFRSLLSLLKPHFGEWDVGMLSEEQRIELARHFVQRTRKDIEMDWEGEHCFPMRELSDETYRLSKAYLELFTKTYDFCSEIVRTGQTLDKRRQRVRYWGALALLRCVMSSPAAAVAALETRHAALAETEDEPDFRTSIFESSDDRTDDEQPTPPIESAEATFAETDRRRLRELARLAQSLMNTADDTKVVRCAELVKSLIKDGFNPIVWCRYVATAEYVGAHLRDALGSNNEVGRDLCVYPLVVTITGRLGDDERRAKIEEIDTQIPRVLVATDCLSEGVNLQEKFNAALHYDLPWNPNRLEQREGRVDRYGQTAKVVKTIRYFSPDSPVDGIVIEVLLNKAREIHRTLGTHVPVPEESETVTEAVLNALFLRPRRPITEQLQLDLGLEVPQVAELHVRMARDAERERINRTRFAQRAIKPDEVKKELEATDSVLGDPDAVRSFVLNAAQRLGLYITSDKQRKDVFLVNVEPNALVTLPDAIKFVLPRPKGGVWTISFVSPTPEGAEYLGRNHRFVATLARYLMEEALRTASAEQQAGSSHKIVSRCGAIRTKAVGRLTTVLLLRIRYLIKQPQRSPLLSEEVLVTAFVDQSGRPVKLPDHDALRLLLEAKPDANLPIAEKRELVAHALAQWPPLEVALKPHIETRVEELEKSHKRVRQAVGMRVRELEVKPQLPVDLLGVLILQPMVSA
jgi:superfamily II DNA or RNA helicase